MILANDDYEVVHVVKPCALLDSNSREHPYWRRDGVALAAGYYVVSWPAGTTKKLFNETARFRGPFKTREDALGTMRALQARALRIGRWPPAAADDASHCA